MNGRLSLGIVALAAAALFAAPAAPAGQLAAQSMGRFRVLVPNFFPQQGADDGFGKDAAKEVRKLLNELPTHQPIEEKEIKDNLKKFKMKMEELDCIKTRQLASQMNAQVALCATYTEQNGQVALQNVEFWDMGSSESLEVASVTVAEKDGDKQAAQHVFDAFDRYVQLVRFQQFCAEYAQSQQWENALRNCDSALELNPAAAHTRYRKARILFDQAEAMDESERGDLYRQAYTEVKQVLAANEFHEEALQLAGYLGIKLDEAEAGRGYYSRYLEINPNADLVRLKVAYDVAKAGDPLGAAQLVKVGLANDPGNAELLEYYGSYMFSAAQNEERMTPTQDGDAIAPKVAALYRDAIDAFEKAYAVRGAEMPVGQLRNIVAGYMQLGEVAKAKTMAEQVVATHPDEPGIWAVLADARQREGDLNGAIAALANVERLQPDYPNLYVRQGNWLLEAGRSDEALAFFRKAVEGGQDVTLVAQLIFGDAYKNGVQKENFAYAIRGLTTAKQFQVSAQMKSQLDFWHGYSLYQQAMAAQKPQTLASAKQSKPLFEQARQYFQAGAAYAATQKSINLQQFLGAAAQYIEIQDAIIKRGK